MSATVDEVMGVAGPEAQRAAEGIGVVPSASGASSAKSAHQYLDSLFVGLTQLTKIANGIPSKSADFDYLASFPEFQTSVDSSGDGILELIQHLVGQVVAGELSSPVDLSALGDLTDEDNFEQLSNVVENLLEAADVDMDAARGVDRSTKQAFVGRSDADALSAKSGKDQAAMLALSSPGVVKPQLVHAWDIDNSRESRFRPRILSLSRSKPNAVAPLDRSGSPRSPTRERLPSSIRSSIESHARDTLGIDTVRLESEAGDYAHPYAEEIRTLARPRQQLEPPSEAQMYGPLETVPCTWVDTSEALLAMQNILEDDAVCEIAVDLEHHHFRSFQGFLCLMQISTRSEDFLVDTIALRDELHVLQNVFTNPRVVKVLHGADRDVLWLQRDLGLYVVNMFDTGQCARVLNYPSKSLAYLLKSKCGVTAQKQYQMADWRIRPLPDVLRKYAREDTHYLLYIYDLLRIELTRKSNPGVSSSGGSSGLSFHDIKDVFARSDRLCLTTYRKEVFTDLRYLEMIRNLRLELSPPQKRVFAALYDWRDRVAREEDESTGYVLPNRMLAKLSTLMPSSASGLSQCLNPVPELVRRHTTDILHIISEASLSTAPEKQGSPLNSRSSETLSGLAPFNPIVSVDAFAPMDIDGEDQEDEETPQHGSEGQYKSGAKMTMEEIYKFAGWTPESWLDPAMAEAGSKLGGDGRNSGGTDASISSMNTNYDAFSMLHNSTPMEAPHGSASWGPADNRKVEEIRASMNADNVPFLRSMDSASGDTDGHMWGETRDVPVESSSEASFNRKHKEKGNAQDDDDAEMIPRSMSEIYTISVQNRNSTKSGTRKHPSSDDSASSLDDAASDSDGPSARKRPAVTSFSSEPGPKDEQEFEFCARIGWIDSKESAEYQQLKQKVDSTKNTSRKAVHDGASSSSPGKRNKSKLKKQRTRRSTKSKQQNGSSGGFVGYNYGSSSNDTYGANQHGADPQKLYRDLAGGHVKKKQSGNARSNRNSRHLQGGSGNHNKTNGRSRRKARGGKQRK
eukprot:g3722.t1